MKEKEPWPDWNSPREVLATDNTLFLGYNVGEWGGATYVIPLDENGISGAGLRIGSFNVCGIKEDRYGNVWIAGGLAHLAVEKAHLYQYSKGKVAVIIDQVGVAEKKFIRKKEQAILEIPITDINGLAINKEGNPVIVASKIGVFEYADGKLSPVIKANMDISYKLSDYWVGSRPMGMVIQNDNIYIATGSLGVFEFKTKNQGYDFQQINFEKNGQALH